MTEQPVHIGVTFNDNNAVNLLEKSIDTHDGTYFLWDRVKKSVWHEMYPALQDLHVQGSLSSLSPAVGLVYSFKQHDATISDKTHPGKYQVHGMNMFALHTCTTNNKIGTAFLLGPNVGVFTMHQARSSQSFGGELYFTNTVRNGITSTSLLKP